MNGQQATESLTREPAHYAVVSLGPVAGSPALAFGYTDDCVDAVKAAAYLDRTSSTFGETIVAVEVATSAVAVEAMPAERLAQIPALAS